MKYAARFQTGNAAPTQLDQRCEDYPNAFSMFAIDWTRNRDAQSGSA